MNPNAFGAKRGYICKEDFERIKNMTYDIYCDESCIEALFDKNSHPYTIIGGIWIPQSLRDSVKEKIKQLKEQYHFHGEMKWNKVTEKTYPMYEALIHYFFEIKEIRFRAICINTKNVDNDKFNNGNGELGFYKFYYQLLHHWLESPHSYQIFLDYKVNGNTHRVQDLEQILKQTSFANINNVQSLPSNESAIIQFADVMTGIVSAAYNRQYKSDAKSKIKNEVEKLLGHKITSTKQTEQKFNIFQIKLK